MSKYYKPVAENRKAFFDYHIIDTFKAGIMLSGAEVKSVRAGNANLRDSFGRIERGEIFLYNMHISPYKMGKMTEAEAARARKLLLNRQEMKKIIGQVSQKGLTIVPIKIYFDGDWAKVDIAIAKAKKKHEKRETLRQREVDREVEKVLKGEKPALPAGRVK